MKTLKDVTYDEWTRLDFDETLDITINTMFVHEKINVKEKMEAGEFGGDVDIELCSTEDDDKLALTEGWIKITDTSCLELNLWRGNGQPYFADSEDIWDAVFNYLSTLEEAKNDR